MSKRDELAAVLGEHVRGDWSDHTYNCQGCARRYEADGQARFDALDREPTRDELIEFRNGYSEVSKPDWTLADYNAHAADAVLAWLTEELGGEGLRAEVEIAVRRAAYDIRRLDQSRNEARADAALGVVREWINGGAE